MKIKWLKTALDDLDSLHLYIAQDKPKAANQIVKKIFQQVDNIAKHPLIGRAGRVFGTRELVISSLPFLVIYRASKSEIEILNVLHTSMRWP